MPHHVDQYSFPKKNAILLCGRRDHALTMSLTDLVQTIAPDKDDDPEDIFASAPGFLFTDDLRNLHGDPDSVIIYKSRRFGNIELRTADPEGEDERRLFSHYLWNAGIKMAELISSKKGEGGEGWSVEGEKVLELGAGADESDDDMG